MNREAAIARRTDITPPAQPACRHGHGWRAPVGARLDRLQRGLSSPSRMPAIVARTLAASGDPLPATERRFMEERFGHDFSGIRVHGDAQAMHSAQAVDAHAYVVGQHLVLGDGPSSLHGAAGRRLLAHELTHTLQQRQLPVAASPAIGAADSPAEREAESAADRIMAGRPVAGMSLGRLAAPALHRLPRSTSSPMPPLAGPGTLAPSPATVPPLPAHGPNPADCMETACVAAARMPAPTTATDAAARVNAWEQASLDCVRAASSNATHQPAIVANEQGEIGAVAAMLRTDAAQVGTAGHRGPNFAAAMRDACTDKAREVRIEFDYNVAFDNPPGAATRWGVGDGSWDRVDAALAALPASATWGNPRLITFHRAACHPDDLDASGQCSGQGSGPVRSFTGAETNAAGTTGAEITVYDHGLGNTPYSRSASTGLSATDQTLRHEVGHVMDAQIPLAEQQRFFRDILPWQQFSWAWLNSPAPRYPNWQAERDELRGLLRFDEAALAAWLATLQPGIAVNAGGWTCMRDARSMFLSLVDASRQPQGREFEYARSGQGEYFAELYAFAVSRPQFLHDALPADQIAWFKRVVFHTPATAAEWAVELAARDLAGEPRLLARLMRVFTWEQIDQILNDQPLTGGARRA